MASHPEILAGLAILKSLTNSDRILNDLPAVKGYYGPLEPYPEPVLLKAINRASCESKWFPSPSELREFCEAEMDSLAAQAVVRAEQIGISGEGLRGLKGRELFDEKIRRWEKAVGVSRAAWNECKTLRDRARLLPDWQAIEPQVDKPLQLEALLGSITGRIG